MAQQAHELGIIGQRDGELGGEVDGVLVRAAPVDERGQQILLEIARVTDEVVVGKQHEVEAVEVAQGFELGDPSVDLVKVMIASQQSQIALRATVEVRNRVVQAYQDIMNMPL